MQSYHPNDVADRAVLKIQTVCHVASRFPCCLSCYHLLRLDVNDLVHDELRVVC